jgi:hypothetical protein
MPRTETFGKVASILENAGVEFVDDELQACGSRRRG